MIYYPANATEPIGGFMAAEILHKGFYDVDVELTDLEAGIPLFRHTIAAVSGLIP